MNHDSRTWKWVVRCLFILPIATTVLATFGCDATRDSANAQAPSADYHWKIVQAYIDMDTAWHAKMEEIYRADDSDEERERRLKEELGEHPDIVLAVVAAKAIVDAGGAHELEAAKFLVEHPPNLSPTEEEDMEFGLAALMSIVGPDWSVVEALSARRDDWESEYEEIVDADIPDDEKSSRMDDLGRTPEDPAAMAAALAIVQLGPAHDKAREAAEFLIKPGVGMPAPNAALKAARALSEHFPDYDNWANVLAWMDYGRAFDRSGATNEFIAEMAKSASDPVVRANARYFAAVALMVDLSRPDISPEKREDMRQSALTHATGLSLGVEDDVFARDLAREDESIPRTLAEMEATVLYGVRHATVGGMIADETGRRLDGSEENLSAYAGKVVLVDFWATWCGPCVGALPDLRELASAYPEERFEILAISVDDEVETVVEFMEEEPMPWAQWHVGADSEIVRTWQVRAYPTYVVVDEDGTILGRSSRLTESKALIEQALNGAPVQASEA